MTKKYWNLCLLISIRNYKFDQSNIIVQEKLNNAKVKQVTVVYFVKNGMNSFSSQELLAQQLAHTVAPVKCNDIL